MHLRLNLLLMVLTLLLSVSVHAKQPDFSGYYDVATLTPLQRPKEFGDNLLLTPKQARDITETQRMRVEERQKNRGPVTEAPPVGGAPPIGLGDEYLEDLGAGSVGGYNEAFVDQGDDVFMIDGKFRTSIVTVPKNGQLPGMTPAALKSMAERRRLYSKNTGTAWWLELDGAGPYDGPESLADSERCLNGFGSTSGPPMLPVLYNNFKRIVQTEDHVMILVEMVHDARIVRLNSTHISDKIRQRFGDSIGWWQGDTLVVDTTNFTDSPGLFLATRNLHVVEKFTQINDTDLLYSFTVDDPSVWQEPWQGEYVWPGSDDVIFEYACHEGNYSMSSILKGARLLETKRNLLARERNNLEQSGQYLIAAPREVVWNALNDPEVLAASLRGCEEMLKVSDDAFTARVKAKIGPVSATFSAELKLSDIREPETYTIAVTAKGGAVGFGKVLRGFRWSRVRMMYRVAPY